MSTSTAAYCAIADVKLCLPPSYNQTTLPDATITAAVLDMSRIIDTDLQDQFFAFNAIGGTPATPSAIEQFCIWRTAVRCYEILSVSGLFDPKSWVEKYMGWYERGPDGNGGVVALRLGKIKIPTETTSSEAISWGAEPLGDNQHKFAAAPKYVIPRSVAITGMVWGVDFTVHYDSRYRGSILTKLGDFVNEAGATVSTIASYDWSYYRNFEIQERPNVMGVIIRA